MTTEMMTTYTCKHGQYQTRVSKWSSLADYWLLNRYPCYRAL